MKSVLILLIIVVLNVPVSAETLERFVAMKNDVTPVSPVKNFMLYGGEATLRDSGELFLRGSQGPKMVYEKASLDSGTVSADFFLTKGQSDNAAFIIKVREPDIGADAFYGLEVALYANDQRVMLGLHRNDFQFLVTKPCMVPEDKWFNFEIKFDKQTYRIFIDGEEVLVYTDTKEQLQGGKIGFRPWQREMVVRNLKINGELIPFEPQPRLWKDWPPSLESFANIPPIALVTHDVMSAPPAVGQDFRVSQPRRWGCSIKIIEPANPTQEVRTIFRDPEGCIYDMNRSFDAKTLYFTYRKKNDTFWKIWQINTDGTGLKQLTFGEHYDFAPCEMPNGQLVFVSSRRFGYTVCQPGPSSNLFVMNADGSDIRCVSMNTLSDFSPQILPDGCVLFTRWEYVDRDLTYRQSLWTQRPDGTAYQLYFGNTIREVGSFLQARPLPGKTNQVVATFAPHHGYSNGAIGMIDRSQGNEAPKGIGYDYITREFPTIGDRAHEWAYRDPYPLSDNLFLCAFGSRLENTTKYRIYLLSAMGEKRLLYEDSNTGAYNPLALDPHEPPPVIAGQTEWSQDHSTVLLTDVYHGIESQIPRGKIKTLRIMEQVRKTEELVDRAYDQSPVMSYGTYYAKRHWGDVPVEEDGSAYFTVPPLREIYFQVLDEEGRELHRMTSAAQTMPGEVVTCVGCHESRQTSPPAKNANIALALSKPPVAPRLPDWLVERDRSNKMLDPAVIDFPSVVQPVLDQYCVECHNGARADGGYDLTGDVTRYFSMSYDNLLGKSQSYRQHNMETGEMLTEEEAKGKPLVHFYWLLWTPTAVHEPYQSGCYASRLPDFLTKEHCGREIPLEDRQRVYLWIDANVPYYATYAHSRPDAPGRRDLFWDTEANKLAKWFTEDFQNVYKQLCVDCHGGFEGSTNWDGKYAWVNLTHPEFSAALTAHLPKDDGGRGVTEPFRWSKDAPDFQIMLNAIKEGRTQMLRLPRADMSDFKTKRTEP